VEVDRLVTLLFVVLKPDDADVDRLLIRLVAVLSPLEVEVDRLVTPLVTVLRPEDVEVDRLDAAVRRAQAARQAADAACRSTQTRGRRSRQAC
ncbi:hypothetical protein, partial [Variovorax sp. E3]|uniref:hypothetical protein n=1 Tax=Variovorax sp. E3 TaxID=1914993 RepID=UPI0022B71CC9